jgi:hypothetical protein
MVANANSVLDVVQQGTPEMRVEVGKCNRCCGAKRPRLVSLPVPAVNIEILVVARDGQINGTAGTIAP